MTIDHPSPQRRQHQKFWLDDGTLVLVAGNVLFKVDKSLLSQHSRALPTLSASHDSADSGIDGQCTVISVPNAKAEDVEALLEHLYHDVPLSPNSPFPYVASILRVSSPGQLDIPAMHSLSRELIEGMFPTMPEPFFHPKQQEHLEEAFALSAEYQLVSIRPGLYYSIVTSCNFDLGGGTLGSSTRDPPKKPNVDTQAAAEQTEADDQRPNIALSGPEAKKCARLMNQLIGHFTPILFTPAATQHMACTDVFADKWMSLVIQPAMDHDGVYKPLETLQNIIEMDWGKDGLCDACVGEKTVEWKKEQQTVWAKFGEWVELEF